MSFKSNILLKLSNIADGLITGAKLVANTITFSKIQQIGAYKYLANITGATADISEVNIGYIPQGAVTLSIDVTYDKADFAGRTHLLLSTNNTTTRRITISNTGFTTGDYICLLIDQNSTGDVSVTIGTRSIADNRGNIINAIFDGTNWNVWSGGGVFNTSSSGFTRTSFGFRAKVTGSNATAFGHTAIASGAGGDSTAFGATSTASGASGCAFGTNSTASGAETSAFGRSSTASGADSNVFGRGSIANGADTSVFGRGSSANSFVRSNAFGNYAYGRRYGSSRFHLGTTTSITDATNPTQNKEWATWNGTTANATITEIFLRGVSSNRCVLQAKNVLKFRGQATAFRSDYSGSAGWDITGLIKRDGSNVTTLIGVTATLTHSDGTGGTLVLTIDADDTNESLRVQVTGNASETWTWLVELELLDLRIA